MEAQSNKNRIGILISMSIIFFIFFFSFVFSSNMDMFTVIPFIGVFWFIIVAAIMVRIFKRRVQTQINQNETATTDDEKQINLEREKLELEKAKLQLEREQLAMKKQGNTQVQMVTCEYCGSSNPADSVRCQGCGSKLHK